MHLPLCASVLIYRLYKAWTAARESELLVFYTQSAGTVTSVRCRSKYKIVNTVISALILILCGAERQKKGSSYKAQLNKSAFKVSLTS